MVNLDLPEPLTMLSFLAATVENGCRFRFSDRSDGNDTLTGTINQVIDQLRRYQEAGVEEVHLLNGGYATLQDLLDGWGRFAAEVIPKV